MAKKSKEIVWHKKTSKFIASSSLKAHQSHEGEADLSLTQRRQREFAKDLADKIKKAAK